MIYLDNNSTTQTDPRVVEAMLPFFTEHFANPASKHKAGHFVKDAIQKARSQVATLLNCSANEIYFTSGATEAINTALKGVAANYQTKGKHIITVKTEHSAVLDVCKYLESHGLEVTHLNVKRDGLIDLEELKNSLRSDTILVCVMFANNETGVIQPINEIASLVKQNGSLFITDATQAVGKIEIDLKKSNIDILTLSGHKFHGPKGIGALYIKKKFPDTIKVEPLHHGGGQENGFRSGTLNTPAIIGLGKACELAKKEMSKNCVKIKEMRDYLESNLLEIEGAFLNGDKVNRLNNTINIGFSGIDADALIIGLNDVAISKGSACSADSVNPSHVLSAMGLTEKEAFSSIRISLSKFNDNNEIDKFLIKFTNAISLLT